MKRLLLITLFAVVVGSPAAQAQGSGQVAGTQCWINGKLVGGFPPGYPCPGTGGESTGSSSSANTNLYNGFYQLGYQFGQWLFGSGSNPQAELQKQQMMLELQRRQAEAERQHQEEEARRLAVMYNRLVATLKLSGLPNLQMKGIASNSPDLNLKLKLGDSADGQARIKGLPGIYLNEGKVPYGIPGLPGIYTGGPGQGSGLTNSELALKIGKSGTGAAQAANAVPVPAGSNENQQPSRAPAAATNGSAPALANESGLQLKTGDIDVLSAAQANMLDPSKMTPQQLADVAELVSRLPQGEQQRLLTAAQNGAAAGQPVPSPTRQPSAQALAPLKQQADASKAAAAAPVLEDASAKARAGFDQPLGPAPVQLGTTSAAPTILRPHGTAVTANRVPAAPPTTTELATPAPVANDWVKLFLFPGSQSSDPFPRNPNPPLTNPLREEQKLQAELKTWDDWVIQRATHIYDKPEEMLYLRELNSSTVKQFAPELLDRYNTDNALRQSVDLRLQYAAEHVALDYYQGLADAHKTAILAFHAELEKLAAAGTLDRLVSLEDQYRLHPERRQIVQSVWERVSVEEQAALAKAQADGSSKLDKEYRFVFQLIREEIAQQR